jgi:ribosomal protein L11 methylase PrmA
MNTQGDVPASFRDPSGFLFWRDGRIYRQVNSSYRENYDQLMNSGLYKALADAHLLIAHEDVDIAPPEPDRAYRIIRPEMIPFVSYPYEWSFSQLKAAALVTLEIQKKALEFDMSLKDSSSYNIQFADGRVLLIDTLSFEKYRQGQPWVAYGQFCRHFLAPLALMSYRDIRLSSLLRSYIDGIPVDLADALLPFRTRFRFSLLAHIHFHARSQKVFARRTVKKSEHRMSRFSLLGIIDSLESAVRKLKWRPAGTEWADYYDYMNYTSDALEQKKRLVAEFIDKVNPKSVWDLGANDGLFSRLASDRGIQTVSFDIDPAAVEKSYLEAVQKGEKKILPLLLDLTNPSPGIGWENEERQSLIERGPADMALALALIHHLAISNNVPFIRIAAFLSRICNWLIIEFVPKADSKVQLLLASREDIFTAYTQNDFEKDFAECFTITSSVKIAGSERTLYLMRRKGV